MANTVQYSIRLDAEVKSVMEAVCEELGMSMSTAFNIFAKKMAREQRIPFDVAVDPFYSESNMTHLRSAIAALNAGQGKPHDLIEVDE